MKQQRQEYLGTEIIRILSSTLLLLAGCILAGMLQAYPAWAGEVQPVTGNDIQPENGFLISMDPETEVSAPIVLETSQNVSVESVCLDDWNTPDLQFTFDSLNTEGQTGFVAVKHPVVGHISAPNGETIQVGAQARYEVTYSRADDGWNIDDKARLKIHASLGRAIGQYNIVKTRATYSFFNTKTGLPMDFDTKSLYYSVSSLNGGGLAEFLELSDESFEKALFKQDGNIVVSKRGTNTVFCGTTNHPDDPGWNETYDHYGTPYYNNNTVMVYPKNGIIDFWVGDEAEGCAVMWWQLSSAPLTNTQTDPPSKTVSTENAHEGETLTYSITQKIGEYGINDTIPYKSLSLVDHLPDNVTYTQGSTHLFVEGNESNDIVDSAGQATYDSDSHTLTYTFSPDYLQNTPMTGQSYRLTFDCVVSNTGVGSSHVKNTASTYLNGYELQGNEVDTLVNNAALSIEKSVSKEVWNVGDSVDYQVTVSNTVEDSVADNVIISDISLPEGLTVTDISSIDIQGISESVSHQVQVDGTVTTQEKPNSFNLEPEGTGWKLSIDYLPAHAPVTITYHARATEGVAGQTVTNTATAVASNASEVQDSVDITINGDESLKHGYEVTTYKSADPTSGSVVEPGSTITYTLEARNTGTEAAAYTFIRDYIPEGTTYVEGSVNRDGLYVAQGNYVEWIIENIEPDTAQKVAYQVTVSEHPPALISNTALYGSAETSPGVIGSIPNDPPNRTNEVMHNTNANAATPALLDLEKTSDPKPGSTVEAGSHIRYTLTLKNNGGQNAEKPCIRDYIPQGTTYIDGSASGSGVYEAASNSITWMPEVLGVGESLEVSFSVLAQDDAKLGTIRNQALFQNNWDGTKDPDNSSNIVVHKLPTNPLVSFTTPETDSSAPTTQSGTQQGSSGSIAQGMAKTGDWIMKNIVALVCVAASITGIALWRRKVEANKTGYSRYGKTR